MLTSCFFTKYNHISQQNQEAGLISNIQNCEKCVEFTNNLSKYAILKTNLNNNLKKKKQYRLKKVARMKNPKKKLLSIKNFFNSLQKASGADKKHFKLTYSDVEYTLRRDFINILQNFIFGQDSHCDIFSDAYESPEKDKKCLKSSESSNILRGKPPKKGTLKHKRWKFNKLQGEPNYEDDFLSDSSPLSSSMELCESDSDTCRYKNAPTPKISFSCSPIASAESSEHEDQFSTVFQEKRKMAEEYQYRYKDKRKKSLKDEKYHSPESCTTEIDTPKALLAAARILKQFESINEESDSASSHSSDSSDLC